MAADMLGLTFACPVCRASLTEAGDTLTCSGCGKAFALEDGIPVLAAANGDGSNQQARYFDEAVDDEFEIERPRGAPRLYEWLLRAKFRYATDRLAIRGASVLVVCGGSGMDAEFLASAGARVLSSDISLGAARRARERARRHGVEFAVVVADAERLPFPDRSFDVVYVHDGLHHLERPLAGLAEMARVSRRAVCVTEPAQAAVTALAVRLRLAQNVEDAGNRVTRLTRAEVAETLDRRGFRTLAARRYSMYYQHDPGPAMQLFSRPLLLPVMTFAFRVVNGVIGPIGNKLVVTSVRE